MKSRLKEYFVERGGERMLYRHYKGNLYRVLIDSAFHSETQEEMVVYMSVNDGKVWIRPAKMFHELVDLPEGRVVQRFSEVH
jgi:hypothetical protein